MAYKKKEDAVAAAKRRRDVNKKKAVKYCGNKCSLCKEKFPHYVYEFHHVVPRGGRRNRTIGSSLGKSWEYVRERLDKCIMLCANCHKRIHNEGEI